MDALCDMRGAIGVRRNQITHRVTKNPENWEFLAVFTVDSRDFWLPERLFRVKMPTESESPLSR